MRQRLRLDRKFRDARRRILADTYDGRPAGPLPETPWFTLDDLLDEEVQPEGPLARAPRP